MAQKIEEKRGLLWEVVLEIRKNTILYRFLRN